MKRRFRLARDVVLLLVSLATLLAFLLVGSVVIADTLSNAVESLREGFR
jgi:hypothetical protein